MLFIWCVKIFLFIGGKLWVLLLDFIILVVSKVSVKIFLGCFIVVIWVIILFNDILNRWVLLIW